MMRTLASKKLPLAWFFICVIVVTAASIVLVLVLRSAPPSNAVLIESQEEENVTRQQTPGDTGLNYAGVPAPTANVRPTPSTISVYVSGAVNSPGVYTIPADSRAIDAVEVAGGTTDEADLEHINLAAPLSDADHINIPRKGEPVAAAGSPIPGRGANTQMIPGDQRLDLNTATATELEALPGIGPVLAVRIVQDRDKRGPFRSVDELTRVAGIKEGIMSQIKDYLTVTP